MGSASWATKTAVGTLRSCTGEVTACGGGSNGGGQTGRLRRALGDGLRRNESVGLVGGLGKGIVEQHSWVD